MSGTSLVPVGEPTSTVFVMGTGTASIGGGRGSQSTVSVSGRPTRRRRGQVRRELEDEILRGDGSGGVRDRPLVENQIRHPAADRSHARRCMVRVVAEKNLHRRAIVGEGVECVGHIAQPRAAVKIDGSRSNHLHPRPAAACRRRQKTVGAAKSHVNGLGRTRRQLHRRRRRHRAVRPDVESVERPPPPRHSRRYCKDARCHPAPVATARLPAVPLNIKPRHAARHITRGLGEKILENNLR